MIELVTLDEAKLFCRVDSIDEDETIATLIGAASAAILDIADAWTPVEGELVPDRIKLAVLAHVALAFDNRDEVDPPASAARLLSPMRRLDL